MAQNSNNTVLVTGKAMKKLLEETSKQIKALVGSKLNLSPEETARFLIIYSCHLIRNMNNGFTTVVLENNLSQCKPFEDSVKKVYEELLLKIIEDQMEKQFNKSPAK